MFFLYFYCLCYNGCRVQVNLSVVVKEYPSYTALFQGTVVNMVDFMTRVGLPSSITSGVYEHAILTQTFRYCTLVTFSTCSFLTLPHPENNRNSQTLFRKPWWKVSGAPQYSQRCFEGHIKSIINCYLSLMVKITSYLGSKVVAVIDSRNSAPSIYNSECKVVVEDKVDCCCACSQHRKSLRTMASRSTRSDSEQEHTHPSSHTQCTAPHHQKTNERWSRCHLETKKAKVCLSRLKQKLEVVCATSSVDVDEDIDNGIRSMIEESRDNVARQ